MRIMSKPNAKPNLTTQALQKYNQLKGIINKNNPMDFWNKNKTTIKNTALCFADIYSFLRIPTLFVATIFISTFTPNIIDVLTEKIKNLWNSRGLNQPIVAGGIVAACYLMPETTLTIASGYYTVTRLKSFA